MHMAVTKRYRAPKFWEVKKKEKKYVVSPLPGPHSKFGCVPLGVALRDILRYARTLNEAKQILSSGSVKVNNVVRKEHGFPVGLMDSVDIGGDCYRVVPSKKGLMFHKIESDAHLRLVKISNKVSVPKKKLQLNFHDGSNMLVESNDYRTSDVVSIDIAHNTIKDVVKFEKGSFAVVTGGHNTGLQGKIESIDKALKTVIIQDGERKIPVPLRYVFVVGRDAPLVSIGEQKT